MRWIGLLVALGIFGGATGGAWMASAAGYGLPGPLEEPVSVRQQSVRRHRTAGPMFLYFGSRRRHYGGGFRGGK